ncbi:Aste57867_19707 [Aphanomyces stellatus]|uniref:Aste57867_19707 protein n=1 Tax=Aphanomyces stellatus TaxID=120398 RepID=A0A485LDB4_9STRA|nr:hypothetical protein As57867_019642 [Aphanomyces stellatus]VFT96406.1 Aste57867_19707 [Aphanomyces stellatus]
MGSCKSTALISLPLAPPGAAVTSNDPSKHPDTDSVGRDQSLSRRRRSSMAATFLSRGELQDNDDDENQRCAVDDWTQYADLAPVLKPLATRFCIDPGDLTTVRTLPPDGSAITTQVGNLYGEPVLVRFVDPGIGAPDAARKAIVAEITCLAKMEHPHIVELKGFVLSRPCGLVCVSECMAGRSLRSLLDNPRLFDRLSWTQHKLNIAIDIASALDYMHTLKPKLIHRNVKAANVLLNRARTVAKLSGFSASRDRSYYQEMTNKIGDVEWSAPEFLMDHEDYTEKIDVYSFGVLLTELDTGSLPLVDVKDTMPSVAFTSKIVSGALRPKLSPDCPPAVAQIVKCCLQHDCHIRPSIDRVLAMLHRAKVEMGRVVVEDDNQTASV